MFGKAKSSGTKGPPPNKPSVVAKLKVGYYEEIGTRPTLEDRVCAREIKVKGCGRACFFGVYDGHGGQTASIFLEKKLHSHVEKALGSRYNAFKNGPEPALPDDEEVFQALTTTYQATDAELCSTSDGDPGSTCSSLLMLGSKLYAANVGDSRVVLCRAGKAVPLTKDQKPGNADEKARIKAAGGFVMNGRVLGTLAVARAFGDREFKGTKSVKEMVAGGDEASDENIGPLVIPTPEVRPFLLDGQEDFLLLACDGLFDVMSNQEAINFAVQELVKSKSDPAACAHALARHAVFELRSTDNVSVLIVLFRDVGASPPPAPPAGEKAQDPPPPYGPPAAPPPEPAAPAPRARRPPPPAAAEKPAAAKVEEPKAAPVGPPPRRAVVFKAGSPLGLQLGTELKTGLLRISNIFEGGAAEAQGLKKHDCVVGVTEMGATEDGEDTRLISHEEATNRIKKLLTGSGGVRIVVESRK